MEFNSTIPLKSKTYVRKSEQKGPYSQRYGLQRAPDLPSLSKKRPHAESLSDIAEPNKRTMSEFTKAQPEPKSHQGESDDYHLPKDGTRGKSQQLYYQKSFAVPAILINKNNTIDGSTKLPKQGNKSTGQIMEVPESTHSEGTLSPNSDQQDSATHTISSNIAVAGAGRDAAISINHNTHVSSLKDVLEPVAATTSASSRSLSAPQTSHSLAPNKRFDKCLNLQTKLVNIQGDIESLTERKNKIDHTYQEQRRKKKYYIDTVLPLELEESERLEIQQAVDEIKKKWKAKGDADVAKLKDEYQGLEKEHKEALEAVDKQKDTKEREKAQLDEIIEQIKKDMSKDEVWQLILYAISGGAKQAD